MNLVQKISVQFYDISYPLKRGKIFDNFFTAKGSLMYSPNSNKDMKTLIEN